MRALSPLLRSEPLLGWRDVMERLRPRIEKALKIGDNTYDFDSLILAVERSRLKLFYRPDAVVFAECNLFPLKKTLTLVLCAGDMDGVLLLEECARAWGKAMGCSKAWMIGRPGWGPIAARRGWKRCPNIMVSMEL